MDRKAKKDDFLENYGQRNGRVVQKKSPRWDGLYIISRRKKDVKLFFAPVTEVSSYLCMKREGRGRKGEGGRESVGETRQFSRKNFMERKLMNFSRVNYPLSRKCSVRKGSIKLNG